MSEDLCPRDLTERLVALENKLQALRDVLTERDLRYSERAKSQDEAVATALATSKDAITKAEIATDRRLNILNELRQVVLDQAAEFSRKPEVKLLVDGIEKLIDSLDKRVDLLASQVDKQRAHGVGIKDAFSYAVGVVGLIAMILSGVALYLRH